MHFAIVALLASSAVSAAARVPAAPRLVGRSATTVTVTGADDAVVLLEALAQPATGACAGAPVPIGDACQVTFQCSEAAAADAAVFEAAQSQLASAVGPVLKSCVCTCGTYCCPLCNFVVPAAVQVQDLGLVVACP